MCFLLITICYSEIDYFVKCFIYIFPRIKYIIKIKHLEDKKEKLHSFLRGHLLQGCTIFISGFSPCRGSPILSSERTEKGMRKEGLGQEQTQKVARQCGGAQRGPGKFIFSHPLRDPGVPSRYQPLWTLVTLLQYIKKEIFQRNLLVSQN